MTWRYGIYDSKDQQGNLVFTLWKEMYNDENQLVASDKIALFDNEDAAIKKKFELQEKELLNK